jgi:hypothetical protein
MADKTLAIREAMVVKMKASLELTGLIPIASIYGERVPDNRTYPFIRTGDASKVAFPLGCGEDGTAYSMTVHGFILGSDSENGTLVGSAIRDVFDSGALFHADGKLAIVWRSGGLNRDPDEPDVWHAYEDFTVV